MPKLVLYTDSARELLAHDAQGHQWDGFYGQGFYRFICSQCGQVKENGWIDHNAVEVCTECVMTVYNLAEVLR